MTTVERLAEAQRELQTIADDLLQARTSKRSVRRDQGRRLNAVNASLRTVELLLRQDEPDWVAQFLQPPVDDDSVYCASRRAIVAATHAYAEATRELASSKGLAAAFIAAHHPDLGVDRSVCLRDVLELLDRPSGEITDRLRGALEEIRDHAAMPSCRRARRVGSGLLRRISAHESSQRVQDDEQVTRAVARPRDRTWFATASRGGSRCLT